jgi:hypothetical protein
MDSVHEDCPLVMVNKHYVPKPPACESLTRVHKMDYVDSRFKFVNYHTKEVEVAYQSDFDLCDRLNNREGQRLLRLYMPPLVSSETISLANVEQCMTYFENEWPLRKELGLVYSEACMDFIRGCARMTLMNRQSRELQRVHHVIVFHAFLFDDTSELLNSLDDPAAFEAWYHNLCRIVHGTETAIREIDLSTVHNFPKELLDKAKVCLKIQSWIMDQLALHGSGAHVQWFRRSWDYFMDGVRIEKQLYTDCNAGQLAKYTEMEFMSLRCQAIGSQFTNVPAHSESSARILRPDDALLCMGDFAVTAESDVLTFFRENLMEQQRGKVTVDNNFNWFTQVRGLSMRDTMHALINIRNKAVRCMETTAALTDPRQRERYIATLEYVLATTDYSVALGLGEMNNRYGWYMVEKTKEQLYEESK